jgi:exosome complex component RRP45
LTFDFSKKCRGSLILTLGRTRYCSFIKFKLIFRVQAIVSAELEKPFPDRPFEGQLSFFVEYSGTAINLDGFSIVGTRFDEDQYRLTVQRTLERAFKTGRAIDLESLCIITGQKVWNIRVDIHILEDDGNVLDAVLISALAGMTDFRRPDVQVSADQEVKIYSSFERHPLPLSFHHSPLSISFSLFQNIDGNCTALIDPTNLEISAQSSCVSLVMNRQGEIIHICKPGGYVIDSSFFLESLIPLAKNALTILSDLTSSAIVTRPDIV